MRLVPILPAFGLVLALAAPAVVARSTRVERTGSDVLAVPVTWSELATAPCSRHGQEVRFAFQFHGRPERWQAGPTRFGPALFAAISGWAEEQFPWVAEEFASPAVRLYVRRGSDVERTLASAVPHQRFEVTGVVREVWRDRPWIEIARAVPLEEHIGEATVIHAGRALELMEERSYVLADEALQQALEAPLPTAARDELLRLREACAVEIATPKPAPIRPRRL